MAESTSAQRLNGPRLALLALVWAALACSALTPRPATSTAPAPTTRATVFTPAATLTAPASTAAATLPAPPTSADGVRECAFVPGVSVPARMPPEVLAAFTPTPAPLPELPANSAVAAETSARQLRVLQQLWNTVDQVYVYPDFGGRDWPAIGEKYRRLVRAGLTDEDFWEAMDLMLAELGDEHSFFESPQDVREADAMYAGQMDYVGIGVLVSAVPQAGRGVILSVFPGGPALEAGLRAHDSILSVDGQPLLDETGRLRNLIRGPEGTSLTLSVQRPGGKPFEVSLTRRRITGSLPVDACLVPGTRLGYLFLPGLDDETVGRQVRQALQALAAAGPLQGLVLDNRQNGGGALPVLQEVLGFFLQGEVGAFYSRERMQALEIAAEDVGGSQTVPLVVLVGPDTVSFGEVLGGVLQASGRARVVGQTTLGNVEIMYGYDFEDDSRAWIAQETFAPRGQPAGIWETTGIVPDAPAPSRWDLFTEADDPGLAVAVQWLQQRP